MLGATEKPPEKAPQFPPSQHNVAPDCDPYHNLQFDIVNRSHKDFNRSETPPYSHDIYAICSPSDNYPVEFNDIDSAFDCDISTLDAYLHGTPCISNATDLTVPQPSSRSGDYSNSCDYSSSQDTDAVKEFFPNLVVSTEENTRRRNCSSGTATFLVSSDSSFPVDRAAARASSEYRIRRDKNNLASQRSRQKRAEKMREMRLERETLERRNIELRTLLNSLELQVADYKRLVLMMTFSSGKCKDIL
ncbi:basic region leucine zipper [Cooperia oncophora]